MFSQFFQNFAIFAALNLIVLINAVVISVVIFKYNIEKWTKFFLSVCLIFILQIFLTQIFLGVLGVLNYLNIWIFNLFLLLVSITFFGKLFLKKSKFPNIPKVNWYIFLFMFSPFIFIFILRYFYALFQFPIEYDSIAYHLPFVVEWFKAGDLKLFYYNAFAGPLAYYPSNFELLELWTIFPFKNDSLINFIIFLFYPTLIISFIAVLKNLNIKNELAWLGTLLFVSVPVFSHFLGFSHVDLFFTVTFIIAIYFLQEFWKTKETSDLILFSISIGFFIGTKYLGLPYSIPLLLLSILFVLFKIKSGYLDSFLKILYTFFFSFLGGGYWYLRNWIYAGNPIFPADLKIGNYTLFEGYYGLTDRIMKDSLSYNVHDLEKFKEFFSGFFLKIGVQSYIFPIVIALSIGYLLFLFIQIIITKAKKINNVKVLNDSLLTFILLFGVIFFFYFYWKAPYSYGNLIANVRYSLTFIVLASILTAFLAKKIKYFRIILYVLVPLIVIFNVFFLIIVNPELHVGTIELDKIPLDLTFVLENVKYLILFLVFNIFSVLVIRFLMIFLHKRNTRNCFTFFILMVSFLLYSNYLFSITASKKDGLKDFFYAQYYSDEPLQNLSITKVASWFDENALDAKIAYSGFNFHYHLFGKNFQREVDYININECLECRYIDYKDSPKSIRRDPNFEDWLDNLEAKEKEYFIIAPTVTPSVKSWEYEWIINNPNKFNLESQFGEVYIYKINY